MNDKNFVWGNDLEEELRRRMAIARAQGWSDDKINRSALLERGVRFSQKQREQMQRAQQEEQKPTKAGRAGGFKGLVLDITPFGRVAEKLINPEAGDITAGEIGMEALLTAAPFGLGRLAKGVKAAKAGEGFVKGLKTSGRSPQTKGLSRALLRNSTIAPSSTMKTASEQQKLIDLTRQFPQLRGSGRRKFQNVDNVIGQLSGNVDDLFRGVDNQVEMPAFLERINGVRREIVDPNELKRFDIEVSRALQNTFGNQAPRLDSDLLFHGTRAGNDFDQFDLALGGQGVGSNRLSQGSNAVYLTDNPNTARYFSRRASQKDALLGSTGQQAADDAWEVLFKNSRGENVKVAQLQPGARIQDLDTYPTAADLARLREQGMAGARFPEAGLRNVSDMPDDLQKLFPDVYDARTVALIDPAAATLIKPGFTPTDINALRREVNKQMSGIYRKIDAGTTLTDKDQAFLRVKEALDKQLTELAPEGVRSQVQTLNRNMNTLMQARPEFKRLAEMRTQPLGLNLPVVSNAIPQGIQATTDIAGRMVANPLMRQAAGQAGARMGADAFGLRNFTRPDEPTAPVDAAAMLQGPEALFADPQTAEEAIVNELAMSGEFNDFDTMAGAFELASLGGMPGGATAGGLAVSSVELFNAAMEAMMAGDSASYKQLAAAAEQAAEMEQILGERQAAAGGGAGGPNITKVTAQQFGLAQSGSNSLQALKQMIQENPGVVTATATPGRKLPIVGGFISNMAGTGEYDAVGYNIADTLLRLRTGATANESEVRNLQSQIMPRAGDSQATIARKIQQLEEAFGGVLNTAYGSGGGGSSFEDELMAMLSGGQQQQAYGY